MSTQLNSHPLISKSTAEASFPPKHAVHVGQGVYAWIETITPDKAEEYLSRLLPNQRKPKKKHLDSLIRDILHGRFMFTGEPIIFTDTDYMADGSHRCYGVVSANKPITTLVVHGVQESAFAAMGNGAKRSGSDSVRTGFGAASPVVAAAVCGTICTVDMGLPLYHAHTHSPQAIAEVYEKFRDEIDEACNYGKRLKHLRQGVSDFAYCYFRFAQIDRDEAVQMFESLAYGEGLMRGDPAFTLRNYLLKAARIRRSQLISVMFLTWNALRSSQKLMGIRIPEETPELI